MHNIVKQAGLKIVYDRTYPPSTADFTPIVRAIQATNPDLVFVASYPPDTVGMIRAASEVGLKTKMFGGGMVGLQIDRHQDAARAAAERHRRLRFLAALGQLREPRGARFPEAVPGEIAGRRRRSARLLPAALRLPMMQVLAQAVEATKTLDQDKLADYIRTHAFRPWSAT